MPLCNPCSRCGKRAQSGGPSTQVKPGNRRVRTHRSREPASLTECASGAVPLWRPAIRTSFRPCSSGLDQHVSDLLYRGADQAHQWAEVEEDLARHALGALWVSADGGTIAARVRRLTGRAAPLPPTKAHSRQELADSIGMVTALALRRLRRRALAGTGWRSGRMSVRRYFLGQCVRLWPLELRRWVREQPPGPRPAGLRACGQAAGRRELERAGGARHRALGHGHVRGWARLAHPDRAERAARRQSAVIGRGEHPRRPTRHMATLLKARLSSPSIPGARYLPRPTPLLPLRSAPMMFLARTATLAGRIWPRHRQGVTVVRAARPTLPDLTVFPGRCFFTAGSDNAYTACVRSMLVDRGAYAPSHHPVLVQGWSEDDREACALFQRAQGWRGRRAGGRMNRATWDVLVNGEGKDVHHPSHPSVSWTSRTAAPPGFPGRDIFGDDHANVWILMVRLRLVAHGYLTAQRTARYGRLPDKTAEWHDYVDEARCWDEHIRHACTCFQLDHGLRGAQADGIPTEKTWELLWSQ